MSKSTTNGTTPDAPPMSNARAAGMSAAAGLNGTDTVRVTANDLRALAEAADGMRKKPAYIVKNFPGEANPLRVSDTATDPSIVIELFTDDEMSATRTPVVLSSTPALKPTKQPFPGQPDITIADCDAVFTSLSAVEKFLVPYYSHLKPLADVIRMRDEFTKGDAATAAFHLPSSYEGLATGGVLFARATDGGLKGMTFEEFIAPK